MGLEQAIDGGLRHEVALAVREPDRQLAGRQLGLIQGEVQDLTPHVIGNAVPDPPGLGRAILQGIGTAGLIEIVPAVEGRRGNAELCQCPAGRQVGPLN